MKYLFKPLLLFGLAVLVSCGGKEDKKEKEEIQLGSYEKNVVKEPTSTAPKSDLADLSNKGIGPVKNLELPKNIDQEMVTKGKAVYDSKCLACHKPDKKFIGPAPTGILERRSPEWVMNMILNPTEMLQKDPIAMQLLVDNNGAPMADQNLTEEEARQILEYFRTLK